jgi:hypothetical protein
MHVFDSIGTDNLIERAICFCTEQSLSFKCFVDSASLVLIPCREELAVSQGLVSSDRLAEYICALD